MIDKSVQFTVDGEKHKVFKVGSHTVVDHPNAKGGVYDLGNKSLAEGKQAVEDWHKNNG